MPIVRDPVTGETRFVPAGGESAAPAAPSASAEGAGASTAGGLDDILEALRGRGLDLSQDLSNDQIDEIARFLGVDFAQLPGRHQDHKKRQDVLRQVITANQGRIRETLRAGGTLPQLTERSGVQAGQELDLAAIGDIASGRLSATPQDLQFIQQQIGATREIAEREFAASLPGLLDQASANAAARGVTGSSSEAASRALVIQDAQRSLANLISQGQQQAASAALQLPLQRAGLQIGAGQFLGGQLLGAAGVDIARGQEAQRFREFEDARRSTNFDVALQLGNLAGRYLPLPKPPTT